MRIHRTKKGILTRIHLVHLIHHLPILKEKRNGSIGSRAQLVLRIRVSSRRELIRMAGGLIPLVDLVKPCHNAIIASEYAKRQAQAIALLKASHRGASHGIIMGEEKIVREIVNPPTNRLVLSSMDETELKS